jgi:hypothetical protein
MKKDTYLTGIGAKVAYLHSAEEDIAIKVHQIVEHDLQHKLFMGGGYLSNKSIGQIFHAFHPTRLIQPRKSAVYRYAGS